MGIEMKAYTTRWGAETTKELFDLQHTLRLRDRSETLRTAVAIAHAVVHVPDLFEMVAPKLQAIKRVFFVIHHGRPPQGIGPRDIEEGAA